MIPFAKAVGRSWIDMRISTSVLNVLNWDVVRYQSEGAKKAGGHTRRYWVSHYR